MRILLHLCLALIAGFSIAAEQPKLFDDKPYLINLADLQALDPKPLHIGSFSPDPTNSERAKGFRILSTGRMFPVAYEVISITGSKPDAIDAISNSLDGRDGIILKEFVNCRLSDRCLRYFERVSDNGKPHHVSSNYLLVKDGTFFHFSASNFAALVMSRASWGDPRPDQNADREVNLLMQATSIK